MGCRVANVPGFAGELQGVGTGPRASTIAAPGLGFLVVGHVGETSRDAVLGRAQHTEEGKSQEGKAS